jgi:hypothetical protein
MNPLFRNTVLNNQNDPGDGGSGGAGGTGQLTEAQLAQVNDVVSKQVNGALNSRLKPIDAKLTSFEKLMTEGFAKLTPAAPPDDEVKRKQAEADASIPPAVKEQLEALKRQTAEQDKRIAERDRQLEDEKQTRRRDEERTQLRETLRKGGVEGSRLDGAVALLYGEQKRLARQKDADDKERITFKGKDKHFAETDYPLEEGVKWWLSTDEGKEYLPARPVGGSGGSGGKVGGKDGKGTPSMNDVGVALMGAFHGGGGG